jgi:hypothetical protein
MAMSPDDLDITSPVPNRLKNVEPIRCTWLKKRLRISYDELIATRCNIRLEYTEMKERTKATARMPNTGIKISGSLIANESIAVLINMGMAAPHI